MYTIIRTDMKNKLCTEYRASYWTLEKQKIIQILFASMKTHEKIWSYLLDAEKNKIMN